MANISRVKTERYTPKEITFTALSTSGKTIDFEGVDENTVLIFTASADDSTVTILKGDGIQGVADCELPKISANKYYVLAIASSEFKNILGTNKGCVVIKGAATTSVAVAEIDQL